jgi:hypothetical protein
MQQGNILEIPKDLVGIMNRHGNIETIGWNRGHSCRNLKNLVGTPFLEHFTVGIVPTIFFINWSENYIQITLEEGD